VRRTEARCAYCHDDAPSVSCRLCGALFHEDCREELGRCTTLGCRIRIEPAPRRSSFRLGTALAIMAFFAVATTAGVLAFRAHLQRIYEERSNAIDMHVCTHII
jgi:hypothetical protein